MRNILLRSFAFLFPVFLFAQTEKGIVLIELSTAIEMNSAENTFENSSTKFFESLGANKDDYDNFAGNIYKYMNFRPTVGYFIVDNFLMAVHMNLDNQYQVLNLYGYTGDDDQWAILKEEKIRREHGGEGYGFLGATFLYPSYSAYRAFNFVFTPILRYYFGQSDLRPWIQADIGLGGSYLFEIGRSYTDFYIYAVDKEGNVLRDKEGQVIRKEYSVITTEYADALTPSRVFNYGFEAGASYFIHSKVSLNLSARYFGDKNWLQGAKTKYLTTGFKFKGGISIFL